MSEAKGVAVPPAPLQSTALAEQAAAGTREIKADEPGLLQLRTQLDELGSERSTLQATSAASRRHLGGVSA